MVPKRAGEVHLCAGSHRCARESWERAFLGVVSSQFGVAAGFFPEVWSYTIQRCF